MELAQFFLKAVIISLSGVMAPGPMTTVTIGRGNDSPHAGAMIAVGHGLVESPLIVAIFFGFGYFIEMPFVKEIIGIVGGLFLLYLGIGMVGDAKKGIVAEETKSQSSVLSGIVLSIGNPYFILWWISVGAVLIFEAARFGVAALIMFIFIHWLCDFVWFYFLSAFSYKGGRFFGLGFQRIIFLLCGIFLFIFGISFIADVVKGYLVL